MLRFNRNVKHWESHPVTIDWLDESGRVRKYTPDVLVEYKPDEVGAEPVWVLCEVKPDFDSDVDLPRNKLPRRETDADNKLKWEAAERYAARRKWQFKVFRESDIRTPYLRNARFLLRYLERRSSMRGRQELLEILKTQRACTLARWVCVRRNAKSSADMPEYYKEATDLSERANQTSPVHTSKRRVIAATVRSSYAPPVATCMPKAMNTSAVVAAIVKESVADQESPRHKPIAATTYAKPARKLNQSTKLT